jgi:hypothetical protein
VRGGGQGAAERLRVDVALVLQRQAAGGELPPEGVQRDPGLHAHEPRRRVGVQDAVHRPQVDHRPVRAGAVREGVAAAHRLHALARSAAARTAAASSASPPGRTIARGAQRCTPSQLVQAGTGVSLAGRHGERARQRLGHRDGAADRAQVKAVQGVRRLVVVGQRLEGVHGDERGGREPEARRDHGVRARAGPQAAQERHAAGLGRARDGVAERGPGVLLHPQRPLALEHRQPRGAHSVEVQHPGRLGVAPGEVARGEAVDPALQDLLRAARGQQDADALDRLGPQARGERDERGRRR